MKGIRQYLPMEWKRAFENRRMLVPLFFGIGLSVWHYAAYIFPLRGYVLSGGYPLSAYNWWIGGECFSLQSTLLYLLLPVACAMPYGGSWLQDCSGSIGGQAIVRGGQGAFVATKLLVSFLSGALLSMFALAFDFALTSTALPRTVPKAGMGLSPIHACALMGGLFYSRPLVYTLAYIGINGLFFGALNMLAVAARIMTANRYLTVLAPFVYYIVFHCAGTTVQRFEFCPSGFLRPCQQFVTSWTILGAELLLIWAICALAAVRFVREEHGLL